MTPLTRSWNARRSAGWQAVRDAASRLHEDESGNVIVLSVVMTLFLAALMFGVLAVGARYVQKETIQTSADAAAFSAAAVKAKGLNIIAFCNLLMAVLLAILMFLRLIEYVLIVAAGICFGLCALGALPLCVLGEELLVLASRYHQFVTKVEKPIEKGMRGLAKIERGVNKAFPLLALAEAYRVGTHDAYNGRSSLGGGHLVTVAFPLPVGQDRTLPAVDGTYGELCDQAWLVWKRVVEAILPSSDIPDDAIEYFWEALGKIPGLKGLLCGGGGTVSIPTQRTRLSCDAGCKGATQSKWTGLKVLRNPNGTFAPGTRSELVTCEVSGFPEDWCKCIERKYPATDNCFRHCEIKGVDVEISDPEFVSCTIVERAETTFEEMQDKPLPLVLAPNWKPERNQVRAFTLLPDSNLDARRRMVGVAARKHVSATALNAHFGVAQAEIYAHRGHEDLWHMNWRARLVRLRPPSGGLSGSGASGAAGAADAAKQWNEFLGQVGTGLVDRLLLH